jgi:hypothetical protein
MAALVVVIAVLQLCAHVASSKPAPHIVYILTDNLGYGGVNFLRRDTANGSSPEVVTPNLDALADSGVILASFYTYKVGPAPGQGGRWAHAYALCSSTWPCFGSALYTGRTLYLESTPNIASCIASHLSV